MRPRLYNSSITRLSVRPDPPDADEPAAIVAPRPRGSRRPHTDAKVAKVRRLIEETPLTYGEIAAKTGVGRASICRWTRDGKWQRPVFAPRATDTVPRERAGWHLKARTLAARLAALAERMIRELEDSATVDADKLSDALELLKMAKLAARPKRRRDAAEKTADATQIFDASPRGVMNGLREGGVRVERAPEDALEDFIASRAPAPKRMSRREREHRWMLERE
jgi:sirohydrochlorin ferrochelatase